MQLIIDVTFFQLPETGYLSFPLTTKIFDSMLKPPFQLKFLGPHPEVE